MEEKYKTSLDLLIENGKNLRKNLGFSGKKIIEKNELVKTLTNMDIVSSNDAEGFISYLCTKGRINYHTGLLDHFIEFSKVENDKYKIKASWDDYPATTF